MKRAYRRSRMGFVFALVALVTCVVVRSVLAGELVVSAAASLTDALGEVKAAYEKANPGTAITTNFAASGTLLRQIEQGAPVDVFASADQKSMDQAAAKGLIDPATRQDFAANALVLIIPAGSKDGIVSPADLAKPEAARIAIGNPEIVPVGRYAMESLGSLGLAEALKPKLVAGESVRQVLDWCVRGEVDAAVVFATDAKAAGDKVRVVAVLAGHQPITYPVAVVAASANKKQAADFLSFVTAKPGQDILVAYGFAPAGGK